MRQLRDLRDRTTRAGPVVAPGWPGSGDLGVVGHPMTTDVLICPNCRARVFGNWQSCKFCGATLRVDRIGATVDPDELVSADASAPSRGGGPGGGSGPAAETVHPEHADTGPRGPWSTWAGAGDGSGFAAAPAPAADPVDPGTPLPGALGTDPVTGDPPDTVSLIPLEGAPSTWAPGPAPTVPEGDHDDVTAVPTPTGEPDDSSWVFDGGPAGLDPVSWYPEPGTAAPPEPDDAFAGPTTGGSGWNADLTSPTPSGQDPAGASPWGTGSPWDAPDPAGTAEDLLPPPGPDPANVDGDRFDPDGLFGDPREAPLPPPPAADDFTQDLQPVAPAGEVAVNWQPAGADAWDVPVKTDGTPKRQAVLSRESRLLLAGIVLVLFVLAAGIALRDRDSGHPTQWASNAQEMADWVAKSRKLAFKHPVAVVTLGGGDYDAAVAEAARPADAGTRKKLADQTAMWRALGGIEGDPSATISAVSAQRPELGAFYDIDTKRLVVRDGADTQDLREGLAGALSVALDDQRTNLSSLLSTSITENPRFAVVLGTAASTRADYVRQRDEKDAGDTDGEATSSDAGATAEGSDRTLLEALPTLATDLGEPFVRLVRASRGTTAAATLAPSPPVSSQQVMLPMAYFDGRGPLVVSGPEVPDGAKKLDEGTIGAQAWYLLIAAHLDDAGSLGDALDFADRWAGDSFVAYRRNDGSVCVTDVLRGSDVSQTGLLSGALLKWKQAQPSGRIEVKADLSDSVTVTACDPGATADQGLDGDLDTAVTTAVTRSRLAAGYFEQGKKIPNGVNGPVFEPHVAWCMGDQAVALAQGDQLADLASRSGTTYRDLTLAAGARCGSNMADQLFVDHGG